MPYIVKSSIEDTWSGSGPGDPDFPPLGRECVDDPALAHPFDDLNEAVDEACTYNQGAFVLDAENGRIVTRTFATAVLPEADHD